MEKLEVLKGFLREVKAELGKVTWTERKQVMSGTVAVLVMSGFIALFLFLLDLGISNVFRLVLS